MIIREFVCLLSHIYYMKKKMLDNLIDRSLPFIPVYSSRLECTNVLELMLISGANATKSECSLQKGFLKQNKQKKLFGIYIYMASAKAAL